MKCCKLCHSCQMTLPVQSASKMAPSKRRERKDITEFLDAVADEAIMNELSTKLQAKGLFTHRNLKSYLQIYWMAMFCQHRLKRHLKEANHFPRCI